MVICAPIKLSWEVFKWETLELRPGKFILQFSHFWKQYRIIIQLKKTGSFLIAQAVEEAVGEILFTSVFKAYRR